VLKFSPPLWSFRLQLCLLPTKGQPSCTILVHFFLLSNFKIILPLLIRIHISLINAWNMKMSNRIQNITRVSVILTKHGSFGSWTMSGFCLSSSFVFILKWQRKEWMLRIKRHIFTNCLLIYNTDGPHSSPLLWALRQASGSPAWAGSWAAPPPLRAAASPRSPPRKVGGTCPPPAHQHLFVLVVNSLPSLYS